MLENLCISRGLTMPKLAIVQSDALNAFASGVGDKQFTVTVTLGPAGFARTTTEVEAVLAHELTHIRNGDVRLMVIAVVIAGVISFVGEIVFRNFGRVRISSDDTRRAAAWAIVVGIAVIAISWLLAVLVRLLAVALARISRRCRRRPELTKNPDAMISALLKISGRADIDGVPSGVMDMCFENDPDDFADLFSTHPSITKRVQALVETAGGRMPAMPPHPPKVSQRPDLPTMVEDRRAAGRGHGRRGVVVPRSALQPSRKRRRRRAHIA